MLKTLHVRNYVLIDSLDISFPEGLIIISGQTGAGKSILLGALSLLTGAKADASVISEGEESCVVEGEFALDDEYLSSVLSDNDIDYDSESILVRRVVMRSGRSRSFINDCPVQVTLLSQIASRLVDIHSQHQSLLLADKRFQMSALDHFAGNSSLLARCSQCYRDVQDLKSQISHIDEQISRLSSEREYNQARLRQLEGAKLRSGELEELEQEHLTLANSEQIKEGLNRISELDFTSQMKECSRIVEKLAGFIPLIGDYSQRLESARIDIEDILSDLSAIDERIADSSSRLEEVEQRMSAIYGLMRSHSCNTVDELIEKRDTLAESLSDSECLSERRDELARDLGRSESLLSEVASALSESRRKSSVPFASQIEKSLRFLELERASFTVRLDTTEVCATGADEVAFLFAADGKAPSEVSKCASGGELSRIMLCLKAMMAGSANMPTMIFDEIDTGVSGSVADKMGSMICDMGERMQIFAITHLPQVAAKGVAHYLVSKEMDGHKTISTIKRMNRDERVQEIARMLSGASVTKAAVDNAKSLLGID